MDKKLKLSGVYDYRNKLSIWKNYAERNKEPQNCEKCKKPHIHKTVLLDNNQHICWYCWIKKGETYGQVIAKPVDTVHKTAKKPIKRVEPKKANDKLVKVIDEGDILENVLGEVDSKMTDTSEINQITKLANSVFLEDIIEPEIVEMVEANEQPKAVSVKKATPKAKTSSKPKTVVSKPAAKTTTVNKNPTPKKTVKTNTKPKTEPKKTEKLAEKKAVPSKISTTPSKPKVAATTVEQTYNKPVEKNVADVETKKQSSSSKFNPDIKGLNLKESKNQRVWWNVAKYSILLIAIAFAVVALYYSSVWQTLNNNGFLVNSGIIKDNLFNFTKITVGGTEYSLISALNDPNILNLLNMSAPNIAQMSLMQLSSTFTIEMYYTMVVFSAISLASALFTVLVKNGTVWSLVLMILSLISITITISLWSLGMVAESAFITPFNEINSLFSGWTPPTVDASLSTNINNQLTNLISSFIR